MSTTGLPRHNVAPGAVRVLTDRHREIMRRYLAGETQKAIGESLGIRANAVARAIQAVEDVRALERARR